MPIAGFPDATNTGVPPGVTLTASGGLVINTPGVVIEGLDIRGMVTINADNVTLRNCRISSDSWAVVNITSGSTGVVVENCEINGLSGEGTRGISGQGTFLRNNIHHTEDGIYILGSNTLIQDNYIHDLQSNWSGPHYDGIATDGGVSNIVIRHNTVINPHGQTSALMLSNYFGSVSNVVVDNNWLEGGGYTVYSDGQFKGGTISGVSFTNNYLVEGEYGYSSIRNNTPVWQGNIEYTGQVPGPTAPSAPTIVSFSDDTGVSSSDRITSDTTLRLSGTAAANGVVSVYDGAVLLGTTNAGPGGAWNFTTAALLNGAHNLTATTTTASGTSSPSTALSVRIDTVVAAPTVATSTVNSNGTVTLTGQAEAGSVVRVYEGETHIGTVSATNGSWSYTTAALGEGAHTLTARATDVAGNASAASAPVTATVSAPQAPPAPAIVSFSDDTGVSSTDRITNDTTVRLSGTTAANGVVSVYDGANLLGTATAGPGGSWSFTTAALSDGPHNLTARVTDSAGRTSNASATLAVTIDTVVAPPTVGAPTVNANGTVTLTGQAETGSVVRFYEGQTQIGTLTVTATNGMWSYTTATLAEGAHTLTARATDVAGNASTMSTPVTATIVGTPQIPPAPAIVSFSDDTGISSTDRITNDTTLRLSGTAAANGVVSIYDGANLLGTTTAGAGGSWNFTTAALLDGNHNLTARVTNPAGHTSNASSALAVTIDTTAPTVPTIGSILDGAVARSVAGSTPAALASNDVTLNGRAEANSTIRVYDGNNEIGSARADASGAWTYTARDLSDGAHSFTSRSVDAAGNASARSAALQVTIDTHTQGPEVDFTSVAQNWNDRVVLRGTADPNDRITIFDNGGTQALGTTTAGADGRWTLTTPSLSDDVVHRFTAAVTDSSGRTISTSTAILGTDRDNRLISTSGDDLFRGNGGHDTFVFAANFGHDTIVDFGAGRRSSDVVQFSRSVFDSFADVLSHATQHGQDVVIDAGGGNTLTLRNTSLSSLDRSDFHFA